MQPADTTSVPTFVAVSKVVAVSLSAPPSVQAALGTVSYVSAPPGTAAGGAAAVIRNRNGGATATAFMFGGGFDPTPIEGSTGDTVDVTMRSITGQLVLSAMAAIPVKRRPIVIRTSPPAKKRDVPLNATITVVFSEPMDPQTVNGTTVRLLNGGQPVSGQLTLDSSGTRAEFVPQERLAANTEYIIDLAEGLVDRSAEQLQSMTVDFTTAADDLSQIAFQACFDSGSGENCGLHLLNADGTGLIALTSSPGTTEYDSSPTWSPDGRKIAFSSLRHCAALGRAPPPNGDCRRELYVMNADGSNIVKVTNLDLNAGLGSSFPAWSPDGTQIAFQASRARSYAIYRVKPDGSDLILVLFSTDLSFGRPAWSPDGTRMAIDIGPCCATQGYRGLHLMEADGSNLRQLTTRRDGAPSWSPDGTRIAFQRFEVDSGEVPGPDSWTHIHLIQPDGQNDLQLTTGSGTPSFSNFTPTWSPDGTRIAFIHTSAPREIRVMNADGSNVRALTTPTWTTATLPAWSPFGSTPP